MSAEFSVPKCPVCSAILPPKAPEGLCPKCLLAGVAAPTEPGTGNAPQRQPPPPREALEAAFPQLEILELIGQGGMGAVFKARQPKLNRFVALKILPESLGRDPKFAERFAREGQLLARLNHPNIVTVHDFGQASGYFYLLMEFVDGVNLRQAMRAGRFTAAQALGIVPKICEALQYAHDESVLHRDIKPENILLDTKGRVKLADFGIAKFIGDVEAADLAASSAAQDAVTAPPQLTSASAALGTPNYMAPEQRECPSEVDHRADIYSLGVVFYEMLTGELPQGKFSAPSAKTPLDPRVDEVVLRALERERERRQQSAGEIKTQVETITTTPPSAEAPPTRLRAPLKSGRAWFTTPERLATFFGGFWWPRHTGELALHEDRLVFTVGWERTEIPFASLLEVGAARLPRWMSPAGHQYLLVTHDDRGQRKRLLFMPGSGWFRTARDTEDLAAEWIGVIRDVVKSATGRNLPGGTDEPTVVPASPWGTLLLLIPPLLVGVLVWWPLLGVPHRNGSGNLLPSPPEVMLIFFMLGVGFGAAALGSNWFRRRNRRPILSSCGTAKPPPRIEWARGVPIGVLLLVLVPFAAFVASRLLSRFVAVPQNLTSARAPASVKVAAKSAVPGGALDLSPKQLTLALFTNLNGSASVNSHTLFAPGETLKSWLVHADGHREPAISIESVFGYGRMENGICNWSWRLPPPFDTNRTDEVVAQLRERWQGKLLSCPPRQSLTLFVLTNESGAQVSGELQFDRTAADPTKPAVAEVKLRNQMTSLLFFTSHVPAGYSLHIRSTGTEVHAAHSTLSRSFSKYSDDATCSWHWMDSDYRGDVSTAAARQVQALFALGPLLVTNGQPRTVFSVTNAAGKIYAGQFELRGPTTMK